MAQLTIPEVQAIQAELAQIKSKRAKVMTGMQRLMQTITVGRGYTTDMVEATLDGFPWEDKTIGQTPAVWIQDYQTDLIRHAGCIREYKLFCLIYGVVRENTLVQFEEFIADIETAIYDNNSLFGECNLMVVTQVNTDSQYFARLDGTRVCQVVVECLYTRRFDNAR